MSADNAMNLLSHQVVRNLKMLENHVFLQMHLN
ncbi:MAG: hypothetical protein CM1200mP35_02240 [Chloroflexota bacterium]|nr:MAG: hypothetical protein CM1200mP35_02240 [Chloroflexota bacterium]